MKLENYILSELFPIDRMRNVVFFLIQLPTILAYCTDCSHESRRSCVCFTIDYTKLYWVFVVVVFSIYLMIFFLLLQ